VAQAIDQQRINRFLAEVERRAVVIAELAVGQREDALDLVQESMLRFVKHYAAKPETQWRPLFHRVLQNRIRDHYRRQRVRRRWLGWLPGGGDDTDGDPIQQAADPVTRDPETLAAQEQDGDRLLAALEKLPARQQQAFLLRQWEGLSVRDTATAMGCSEGSVKTHLSRALKHLRGSLDT